MSSGSPASLRLEPAASSIATVPVVRALMRRGVNGRIAKHVCEQLAFGKAAAISVPHFDGSALVGELEQANVSASQIEAVTKDDIIAVRKRLNMSQEQFAEFFSLDVSTVRNWEQGRTSVDRAAAVLIKTIARAPDVVHDAAASQAACVPETPALAPTC